MAWNEGAPVPEKMSNSRVSQAIGSDWDGGDPWGSAMSEGFALCDFVAFYLNAPEEIPDYMGYSPSIFGPDDENYLYQELVNGFEHGDFTAAEVFDYLPILHEYINVCVAAGLDY